MNDSEKTTEVFYCTLQCLYRVQRAKLCFSAEETDFGEIYALLKKGNELVPAPQLRCPAEITYVFKNEPKVKEIVKNAVLNSKKRRNSKINF